MSGIQYVTDEKGRKVAVQIDLKVHRELWEDIEDVLVSQSRGLPSISRSARRRRAASTAGSTCLP